VSLNELHYVWPVAFGSYVLEAKDPDARGLTSEQLAELSKAVGCELLEIQAHV